MASSRPFFSVVIPTLNEEKFIKNILQCLVNQTYRSFEVIVCDGNSNDDTRKIVASFRSKLPKLTTMISKVRNVSVQRNLGVKKVRGECIIFFDADVLIDNKYLDKVNQYIRDKHALFLTTLVSPDSNNILDKLGVLIWNLLVIIFRKTEKVIVSGHNIIVNKKLFEKIGGFDPQICLAEDHSFAKQAVKLGYSLDVCLNTIQTLSFRRIRREGRLVMLTKYMQSTWHTFFKGAIKKKLFDYQMGGQLYNE